MHPSRPRYPAARFGLRPIAASAAGLWMGLLAATAWAQQSLPAPALQASPQLQERISPAVRSELPVYVEGDRISGRTELETTVEGSAALRRGDTLLRGERIEYDKPQDQVRATGDVYLNRAGDVYMGPRLEFGLDSGLGVFVEPSYRFLNSGAYGNASLVEFLGEKRALIHKASYTTCQPEPGEGWQPEWLLTADKLLIDEVAETGLALGAKVRFFGVPVLPVPVLSFPLSDKRKSGLLPPVLALNNRSGAELTLPYYWNIAPNRDATFYPTLMARRGLQLGGEFRYLEPTYSGASYATFMPQDRLRERDRWAYSVRHQQTFPSAPGYLGLNLNLNRVSDDDYWKDFTRSPALTSLTQRLLASDSTLTWAQGDFWAQARSLRWQVLQDVTSPIVPPYDRLPQLQGRYTNNSMPWGVTSYVEADYTQFHADRQLTGQPNAARSYLMAQFARPWQAPGWFVTPRLQLHSAQYEFDTPLPNGLDSAGVTVPTFSLDSGLIFERSTSLLGRSLVQTLEPRALYVYTPYRSQNFLPVYDAGLLDFNFATIFSENPYLGHDRIADSNLLTLGATSRFQDADTGAELGRIGLAQRLRFANQRVTLPGTAAVNDRVSDLLFGAAVNWTPRWTAEGTVQYNPKTGNSERSTLGARYNPKPYHTLSAAYRFQRDLTTVPDTSELLDLAWQWPLDELWGGKRLGRGRLYSVGRLNMSLKDHSLVDSIIGLEYDGCCWVGRVVLDRTQTGSAGASTRLLFQIELLGLTRVGSGALSVLRDNIPRYQLLHQQTTTPPSRFTVYDTLPP